MSDYRVTAGLIARLVDPVPKEDWESITDRLFQADVNLHISYDGMLVYSTDKDVTMYEFDILIGEPSDSTAFSAKCEREGLCIDPSSIKPYVSLWYDGADSPMSTTEIGDFLNANQKN